MSFGREMNPGGSSLSSFVPLFMQMTDALFEKFKGNEPAADTIRRFEQTTGKRLLR